MRSGRSVGEPDGSRIGQPDGCQVTARGPGSALPPTREPWQLLGSFGRGGSAW